MMYLHSGAPGALSRAGAVQGVSATRRVGRHRSRRHREARGAAGGFQIGLAPEAVSVELVVRTGFSHAGT